MARIRALLDRELDRGHGECVLGRPWAAEIVRDALLRFHRSRYLLLAWVVMPNHVHAVLEIYDRPLAAIIRSWKSFTARQINAARGTTSAVWQRDYHDRYIRDQRHLENAVRYAEWNPVKAGLCRRPEDWIWSSASGRREDPAPPAAAPPDRK